MDLGPGLTWKLGAVCFDGTAQRGRGEDTPPLSNRTIAWASLPKWHLMLWIAVDAGWR
jgi:hypothetical protein